MNFDSSGELSNVKVGTQTLVSYCYSNDVSKLLTQTQYGNNQTINYTYNSAGKIATIKFNNDATPAFEYTYNTNGDLSEKKDNINNLRTLFSDDTVTISKINTNGTTTFVNSYQTTTTDGVNKFIEAIGSNVYTTQFLENKDKFVLNDTSSLNKNYSYNADQKIIENRIYKHTVDTNSSILVTSYNYETTDKKTLNRN